jgi:hypothetical protein
VREFATLPIKIYGGRVGYFAQAAYALFSDQQNPFLEGREIRVLIAHRSNRTIARVVSVIDHRHRCHWGKIGHLVMFDATADAGVLQRSICSMKLCAYCKAGTAHPHTQVSAPGNPAS